VIVLSIQSEIKRILADRNALTMNKAGSKDSPLHGDMNSLAFKNQVNPSERGRDAPGTVEGLLVRGDPMMPEPEATSPRMSRVEANSPRVSYVEPPVLVQAVAVDRSYPPPTPSPRRSGPRHEPLDSFIQVHDDHPSVHTQNTGQGRRNEKSETLEVTPRKSKILMLIGACLLSTSPSPRDRTRSRMPSSA